MGNHENQFTKAKRLGLPKPPVPGLGKPSPRRGCKISEETKRKISEGRKKWIRENPDKYPWKQKDKSRFRSIPCEQLKDILRKDGYEFVEEFTDSTWSHMYSLDIAFLDKKLAIEVNGTQHYDRTGSLMPYYQKRHDYLVSKGWTILEVYYATCFKKEELEKIKAAIDTGKPVSDEEHKRLFQDRVKSKAEKEQARQERIAQAKKDGTFRYGKIQGHTLTNSELLSRKEKILNCGVDFTKFGWISTAIKATGLTKRQIEFTIEKFKDDFSHCRFGKKRMKV